MDKIFRYVLMISGVSILILASSAWVAIGVWLLIWLHEKEMH